MAAHCRVTGVDISPVQLALARHHVPNADFVLGDMTALEFSPRSFDAVVVLYAMTHVPRAEHGVLLGRIAGWLRSGGLFLATMGSGDSPDQVEPDPFGLGVPMFFSHFDAAANRELLHEAGFQILGSEVVPQREDGKVVRFLWVLARK
jgi:SAM-dependent methyltransferase